MSVTITDEKLITDLDRSRGSVEVRAAAGRILGVFIPTERPPEPPISEEELRRREEDRTPGTWYTAAEVEAKLRELRQCGQSSGTTRHSTRWRTPTSSPSCPPATPSSGR